jgi:phosphomannomutase / phosphoglucomutase
MSVFKAYDIRGLAYSELDSKFAEKLGRALATHLDAKTVAVASDIRESGPELHEAFLKGLNASGADVLDLGITTTGVLYRATVDLPVDASVVITASHNPPEYNGFKICNGTLPMAGKELQELKETFDNNIFKQGNGSIKKMLDFENEYLGIIVENAGVPKRKMKIAIDCGNAVPGPLTIKLMEKLGVELIPVHCDWNNKFPNHPPDPTRPENMNDLANAVIQNNAEFGIGMDGDGDRIGVVDETGKFIHPDRLMTIFAKDILGERKGGTDSERTVFFDVKCSMALEDAITSAGGIPVMVRTGHSFMKKELKNNPDSPLAGEMSGHFFLNDRWPGFDDSLYNTARLLEIIAREPSPENGGPVFSDWFSDLPQYASTGEAKVPLSGNREKIMQIVEGAFADMQKSTVDGVRVRYSDGWYLCRPSNTEPILVMRAEASNEEGLIKIKEDVEYRLGAIINLERFHQS